ncbi:MAG: DUF488 domain-containing protein [Thermoplasmataceae archaeon]
MLKLKRIYDSYSSDDGFRVLVERLWPRGVSKENAHVDLWLKEIAPSPALRKWFNHEDAKWEEFQQKYRQEINGSKALEDLVSLIRDHGTVTLVFSSRNEKHNNAVVLFNILQGYH